MMLKKFYRFLVFIFDVFIFRLKHHLAKDFNIIIFPM